MPGITFKVAGPGDRDTVFGLLRSAALWLRSRDIDYWQNWLSPPDHHLDWIDAGLSAGEFRLIESGGRVVGCMRVQRSDEMFWGPDAVAAGYVHSFTVHRSLSGRGIGRAALDMLADELATQGAALLRLDCGVDVAGLRRYYEQCGFVAVGQTVVDGEDLVLYERVLGQSLDR
jgi:ribosomal protein S18 acetylase RimI-like enzyme